MSDKMMFPENIYDFLSDFAFKDSEEIYTNGSMLIPVFRVEQALEHYGTEIRNKAIDDFAEALKGNVITIIFGASIRVIDRIAEQLKN